MHVKFDLYFLGVTAGGHGSHLLKMALYNALVMQIVFSMMHIYTHLYFLVATCSLCDSAWCNPGTTQHTYFRELPSQVPPVHGAFPSTDPCGCAGKLWH
jgi:hypothetical protein